MAEPNFAEEQRIRAILMPYAEEKRAEAINNDWRLAHYASAETAIKILSSKEIWLRDSRCMNDFMEVQTGLGQIRAFLGETARRATFVTAVDACHPGIADAVIRKFDEWISLFWANTYIMCLSVHKGGLEDNYGRLSMWRAYGRASGGVAIVFNPPIQQAGTDLHVFLSPVAYRDSIDDDMIRVIDNITANQQFLASISRDRFLNSLFSMFAMAAVCIKSPGFREEEEWRLVHLPRTWKSEFVSQVREYIDGVPQYVYKMKFSDAVKAGHAGAEPTKLIEKVIVGPTAYPGPISEQIFDLLKGMGFSDPNKHLVVSKIPLRM